MIELFVRILAHSQVLLKTYIRFTIVKLNAPFFLYTKLVNESEYLSFQGF